MDDERARAALETRREALTGLSETAHEEARPEELDQARIGRLSRIDALQGQAMAAETERRREAELGRIDAALKRLEEGEYGYCVACGKEIADARLEADPSVANCIDCARKGERV